MRRIYGEFKPWIALLLRRRRRFMIGTLLVWITLLAGLSLLGLSGWFIAACALTGIALVAGLPATLDIYVPGGGIRFFALLRTVARYVERLYNHNTVLTLLADLRFRVFGDLTRLDDASLRRHRASDWLSRLTADIDTLDNFYLRLLMPPLVALLCLLAASGFIAFWLPEVALMVAISLTVMWLVITLGYASWGLADSHQQVTDQRELRHLVLDQLQAAAELKSYHTSAWHQQKIRCHEQLAAANHRRLTLKAASGNALVTVVTGVLMLAVLWLASLALEKGQISGPVMVMVVLVALGINEAFTTLPAAFMKLGASYASVQRLNGLSNNQRCATSVSLPDTPMTHVLRASHVSFYYPNMLEPALDNISFVLPAEKRAVVTGISGAGKSTLAQLLMGRLTPSMGKVSIAGLEPSLLSSESRAKHFAVLTQQVDLFDASLADNLRIADPEASDEQLWRVLGQVALDEWVKSQPRHLDTSVGEQGSQLSGGQARRVALARLLLRNPSVVLLDEPFAGLDAQTANYIARTLDQWLQGKTVIYFVHQVADLGLLPGVEYGWRLTEGRLIPSADLNKKAI